jgi:hypothetical protein
MRRKVDIRSASLDKRKATSEGIKVLDVQGNGIFCAAWTSHGPADRRKAKAQEIFAEEIRKMRLGPIYQEFTGGSSEHTALELGRRSEVEPVVPLPYVAFPWMEGQGLGHRSPAFLLRKGSARHRLVPLIALREDSQPNTAAAPQVAAQLLLCPFPPPCSLTLPSAYVQETRPGRPQGHGPPGHLSLESEARDAGLP